MKLLACLCFIVLGIASAKYTILTSAYYPLVVCTTGSVGLEATKFSGIQVDMLRALAKVELLSFFSLSACCCRRPCEAFAICLLLSNTGDFFF